MAAFTAPKGVNEHVIYKLDPELHQEFRKLWRDNEKYTASYLGYNNLADFRRLRTSVPVLKAFMVIDAYVIGSATAYKKAFEILLNHDRGFDVQEFGRDLPHLLQMYPQQTLTHSINAAHLFAGTLFHLGHMIEAVDQSGQPIINIPDEGVFIAFETQCGLKLRHFDYGSVIAPQLGPIAGLDEHIMERYSRLSTLMRSLHDSTWTGKWDRVYWGVNDPFKDDFIEVKYIPNWMRDGFQPNAATAAQLVSSRQNQKIEFPSNLRAPGTGSGRSQKTSLQRRTELRKASRKPKPAQVRRQNRRKAEPPPSTPPIPIGDPVPANLPQQENAIEDPSELFHDCREFALAYNNATDLKAAIEIFEYQERHLKPLNHSLSKPVMCPSHDPQHFESRETYIDAIRNQLLLPVLRVDFKEVFFWEQWMNEDGSTGGCRHIIYSAVNNEIMLPWDKVQKCVAGFKHGSIPIEYTLMVLREEAKTMVANDTKIDDIPVDPALLYEGY
jgi:hypothetical protein